MHHHATRSNGQKFGAPYKKSNFKMQTRSMAYNPMNFNVNQIPDNPGYLDFSEPTPFIVNNEVNAKKPRPVQQQQLQRQHQQPQQKKSKNAKNKQGNKQNNHIPNNWNKNRYNPPIMPGHPLPLPGVRNRPPMPGPLPLPHLRPPLAAMPRGVIPQPPPPPYMRRNGRGAAPIPLPPRLPIPGMLAPPTRMPRGIPPPIPYGGNGTINKAMKPIAKSSKKPVKTKSNIRTLKNIVNQYPLDKPWVTTEIRAEHEKKIDIENRLKGNKDDNLFAQFKVQRDKFVGLYETARENYLKQEAAAVKIKETNNKETVNQTTEKDANCSNQEAIAHK